MYVVVFIKVCMYVCVHFSHGVRQERLCVGLFHEEWRVSSSACTMCGLCCLSSHAMCLCCRLCLVKVLGKKL